MLTNPVDLKAANYEWAYVVAPFDRVILLELEAGAAVGRTSELLVDGRRVSLDNDGSLGEPSFAPAYLYSSLLRRRNPSNELSRE